MSRFDILLLMALMFFTAVQRGLSLISKVECFTTLLFVVSMYILQVLYRILNELKKINKP